MRAAPGLAIGALRQRVRLEARTETPDGGGGLSVTWTPLAEIWASIEAAGAGETSAWGGLVSRITHKGIIRTRNDAIPGARLVWGSRALRVRAVRRLDPRGRFLALDLDEEARS